MIHQQPNRRLPPIFTTDALMPLAFTTPALADASTFADDCIRHRFHGLMRRAHGEPRAARAFLRGSDEALQKMLLMLLMSSPFTFDARAVSRRMPRCE
jgi:hypothetical protein